MTDLDGDVATAIRQMLLLFTLATYSSLTSSCFELIGSS